MEQVLTSQRRFVIRLSDKIAYINHDIDDAIRAGILTEGDIPRKYADVLGDSTKRRLDGLIRDVVNNSMDKNDIFGDMKHGKNTLFLDIGSEEKKCIWKNRPKMAFFI